MWELFASILEKAGYHGLIEVVLALTVAFMYRAFAKKDTRVDELQKELLAVSEKRLLDVKEEKENYQELATNLDKSINLLVKVFKERNGNGGGTK